MEPINSWDCNDLSMLSREDLVDLVHRKTGEVHILTEVNRRLRGHFEINSVLQETMEVTKNLLKSEACSIFLIDEDSDQLFFYVTDEAKSGLDEIRLARGQGIVGQVVESGENRVVNDTSKDHSFFAGVDDVTGFVTSSLVCVPMKVDDQIIGAVEALNKINSQYTIDDVETLESIAAQAALAIQYVKGNEKRSVDARMAVVGNMASQVIHDLRNSMQVISGFSQLIAIEQPDQAENCEIIHSEIEKLVRMSQEILEFSKGSSVVLNLEKIDLASFIRDLYQVHRHHLGVNFGIDLEYNRQDTSEVIIDRVKMERVILNLLSNARAAVQSIKKIMIRSIVRPDEILIEVEDFGKGMDQTTLRDVFKPFFTKGKIGGSGLGMAIVKNIIEGHKGEIEVKSEEGVGTTFSVKLPRTG